jgi:hypothetical protein
VTGSATIRALALAVVACGANAQDAEVQRALIERDQRTLEFAARLKGATTVELQRLDNAFARQRLEALTDPIEPVLRPYQRMMAGQEGEGYLLRLPPPVVRAKAMEELRPLVAPEPCKLVPTPGENALSCR